MGAFGAHALAGSLNQKAMSVYQTAVHYQMFHALALIVVGAWGAQFPGYELPAWAFAIGTLLFSGSLYALAITDVKILGAITPVGGVAFLVGWIGVAILAFKAA
jgi:uncharacterized membrane protein YgdD (TMEM256/DUF423 family)